MVFVFLRKEQWMQVCVVSALEKMWQGMDLCAADMPPMTRVMNVSQRNL